MKAIIFCALTFLPMGNYKANLVVINKLLRDLWLRCAGKEPDQVTRKCPHRRALGMVPDHGAGTFGPQV